MVSRRLLATVGVIGLLATVGCLGQFGTGISEQQLSAEHEYEWDTDARTEIRLSEGSLLDRSEYHVVYSGNDSVVRLSTRGITRRHAVDVKAVQYRYADNDTVAGHEAVEVSQTARQTTLRVPEADGQLAFTGERRTQELHVRTFDDGNVSVVLPPGHTVGDLLLSDVVPAGYEVERGEGRTVLEWTDVEEDSMLLVRHYTDRDWLLFYSLLTVTGVAALLGYVYFTRQIRRIRRKRERHGLEMDQDDDGKRPPPGMG